MPERILNVRISNESSSLRLTCNVIELLRGTRFEADIPLITNTFNERTKLAFASPTDSHYIRFGRLNDNAPELNIRAGQLKLSG